jgi:HAD superfamily hydrolase (TIGR01509 family)
MPHPLKALLFDAGDVIYRRPRRGQALHALLAAHGLASLPSSDEGVKALRKQSHLGTLARDDYFRRRLVLCGVRDDALLAEGVRTMADAQSDIELFDGVAPTLQALKAAGVKLAVVTNTHDPEVEKRRWFTRFGIDGLWDAWASSCELHLAKPEPAIYRWALDALQVAPADAAFVGHTAKELGGARAVGLRTISFNPDTPEVRGQAHAERFADLLDLAKGWP